MDSLLTFVGLADLLVSLAPDDPEAQKTASLLRQGPPDPLLARLDARRELLKRHFDAIAAAIAALSAPAAQALAGLSGTSAEPAGPDATGDDSTIDHVARTIIDRLECWPVQARQLAVSLCRLLEDSQRVQPRPVPLGRGFEDLLDERLARRFALLPGRVDALHALHACRQLLLEEPAEGLQAIEQLLDRRLDEQERAWIEVERRVGMLRFVRRNKTEEGHIRWFVRRDPDHTIVLDRLGVHGYWLVLGDASAHVLAQVGTAFERVGAAAWGPDAPGWRVVRLRSDDPAVPAPSEPIESAPAAWLPVADGFVAPSSIATYHSPARLRQAARQARAHQASSAPARIAAAASAVALEHALIQPSDVPVPPAYRFELRGMAQGLSLWATADEQEPYLVAQVATQPSDDELIRFLECVDRVADLAEPAERLAPDFAGGSSLVWVRALLRERRRRVRLPVGAFSGMQIRLVYVPSAIPHQLGGVPEVGLAFLRDHLERLGARVDSLGVLAEDFDRRLVELLGADVVGIGVYIHNRDDVAALVAKLRAAGFRGKIVLGGPETRNIDAVQSTIPGWDAIIRGESEEVLPSVLEAIDHFAHGRLADGFAIAARLRGVALRVGSAVLLCETAARNRAQNISCPLPFDWSHGGQLQLLKMNFTRGCPYQCVFCPNHQGRRFRSGPAVELWRYSVLAVADNFALPPAVEQQVAQVIQERLAVASPARLRVALHVLWRIGVTGRDLKGLVAALEPVLDTRAVTDGSLLEDLIGLDEALGARLMTLSDQELLPWHAKETWLLAKATVLASRQLWRQEGAQPDVLAALAACARPAFVLETSEDNTLVNRAEIAEYMGRRKQYGLTRDFVFNPGQNTIWDLTRKNSQKAADEHYIALLAEDNPFAVALGTDGASNVVIRQNRKPQYGIADVLAVNKALSQYAVKEVANNYILLTPETNLLETIEAFVLFLLMPIRWRDYDSGQYTAINLRVIKEETTLSNDEGLIFAPLDQDYNCPFRFGEVQQLLDRWSLTSMVSSKAIRPLLWQLLEEDTSAATLLPLVVQRWAHNVDADPELEALAQLVWSEARADEPLVRALRRVEVRVQTEALISGQTRATFRDLLQSAPL